MRHSHRRRPLTIHPRLAAITTHRPPARATSASISAYEISGILVGGGAPTSIPNKRGQTPLTIQPLLFAAPLLTCSQVSEYERCISEYLTLFPSAPDTIGQWVLNALWNAKLEERPTKSQASMALEDIAAMLSAVASVIDDTADETLSARIANSVATQFVDVRIKDDEMLSQLAESGASAGAYQDLASTEVFRCVIVCLYGSGPALVFRFEIITYLALFITFSLYTFLDISRKEADFAWTDVSTLRIAALFLLCCLSFNDVMYVRSARQQEMAHPPKLNSFTGGEKLLRSVHVPEPTLNRVVG